MDWVTRVAMKASSLILVTIQELNSPTTTPPSRVSRTAGTAGTPQLSSSASSTPEKAARDPGERSFWAAMIRYVWPMATMPTSEIACRILVMFATLMIVFIETR